MDTRSFIASTSGVRPPDGLSLAMQALWWDAKGDWERAHVCAQERDDVSGMRVHAYLHRKEGDPSNAAYWYRRAGVPIVSGPLEQEWDMLIEDLGH